MQRWWEPQKVNLGQSRENVELGRFESILKTGQCVKDLAIREASAQDVELYQSGEVIA